MSRNVFNLVSVLIGAAQAAGVAIVTFLNPTLAVAINSSIVIARTATIEICNQFVKD